MRGRRRGVVDVASRSTTPIPARVAYFSMEYALDDRLPIYAGGLIYLLSEEGTTTVFKPGDAYDPVATNKLGEKAQASFAVEGDALFLRTEKALYRIEKK